MLEHHNYSDCALEPLSLQLLNLHVASTEAAHPRARALQPESSPLVATTGEKPTATTKAQHSQK